MYGDSILIKKGLIVTSTMIYSADVKVINGKISELGSELSNSGVDKVIDADGFYVFPGIVDEHVHMREPGLEYKDDFAHGTAGAAIGGVTTVLEMPNTKPPVENAEVFRDKLNLLSSKANVDFGLYGVIHNSNAERFEELVKAGVIGFKVFLGPTTGNIPPPDDGALYEVLLKSARLDLPIAFHAENAQLVRYFTDKVRGEGRSDPAAHMDARPPICEEDSIRKLILFSKWTGGRIHIVHLAAKEGVELIKEARSRGLKVTAETCPHYLLLNSKDYGKYGTAIKVNPPIRSEQHQKALWQGVFEGVISTLGSDHAPHAADEKKGDVWKCAAGFTGVQTFFPLMLDQALKGRLSLTKLTELMSENPAKLFRLWPRKGAISVGSDGDLVIVDPRNETIVSKEWLKAKYPITPYMGWRLKGRIKYTILRGKIIAQDGELISKKYGVFVRPGREGKELYMV